MNESRPWWAFGCSSDLTEQDLANLRRLNIWMFVLVALWLGSLLTLSSDWTSRPAMVSIVILPAVALIFLFRAVGRFLREADELTRRMHVRSYAVGFGAGFAALILERLAVEAAEFLWGESWPFDVPDLFDPFIWMVLAYTVSLVRLERRYRR